MVNISIDVTDLGGEARPGDKVVLWKPAAAGSATHAGRVISTAPVDVFLTNGKATVPDVEPGSMRVLLQCRGVESQGPIDVTVPDGNGTVTLRSLIESQFEYAPPIVSAVQEAAANASASERAAIEAQVRSEAAADRADAKVDDAINNGANLVRNEVKQDADRAVAARQAATQSETNAKASEDAAASSASNAKTSETNAKQSETNAGDCAAVATTAATEAVDAMESASDAVSSIGDSVSRAAASADSASQSETNAAQYESSAATHARNVTETAEKVGTVAELDAWAQAAQEAADRVGTAEQVGTWASESSAAASRAAQSETNAKASEEAAATSESNAKDSENAALDAVSRIDALEAMAGLSPESPVDGQTANLIAQPETMTRKLLNRDFATAEVVGQPNYVALMASRSHYSTMTVTKTSESGALEVKCANTDGTQFVAYTVTNPNRYQYIGGVSASSLDAVTREINFDDFTTTGTYLAVTTSPYTTQVGATWQVQIEVAAASTIQMRHYVDRRGGVWRVSVVEIPELTADISTFDLTAGLKYPTLFTIPTAGMYTIRGEFLGEDPDNPPTTGVPARGWLGALGSAEEWTLSVPNSSGGISTVELSPLSNKDFAFRMKPAGTDANSEFIPYHGTASEVFASPTQYYSAGALLDIDALPVGEPAPVDSFEIVQHIYGRNSTAPDPTQNIAEFWTTQKIAPDGTYYASGRWKALVDIEMHSSSYPMMLMGRLPLFDEVISSVGTSHAVSGEDTPRNIWLTQERDLPEGYAMLSSTSDCVAAVQVDARRETLRAGAPDKPGNMAYIELRTGGIMAKIYQRIYDTGVIVPAGTIQRFGGSYWYGAIPGMHSVLSLS